MEKYHNWAIGANWKINSHNRFVQGKSRTDGIAAKWPRIVEKWEFSTSFQHWLQSNLGASRQSVASSQKEGEKSGEVWLCPIFEGLATEGRKRKRQDVMVQVRVGSALPHTPLSSIFLYSDLLFI